MNAPGFPFILQDYRWEPPIPNVSRVLLSLCAYAPLASFPWDSVHTTKGWRPLEHKLLQTPGNLNPGEPGLQMGTVKPLKCLQLTGKALMLLPIRFHPVRKWGWTWRILACLAL